LCAVAQPTAMTDTPDDEETPPDGGRAPGVAFRHDLRRAAGDDDAPTAAFE